jgi:hypothetical protein
MSFFLVRVMHTAERFGRAKGTGFSPYSNLSQNMRALAPEGNIPQICSWLLLLLAALSALLCAAQTAPQPEQSHKGQVIFSRSSDENGQTTTQSGPTTATPTVQAAAPIAKDDERRAVTFTAFDLDVHLRSAEQQIAVRAQLTIRNDGKTSLTHIPLQLSSSLNWERIRVGAHDVAFQVATLNSDVDHTGQLHEAIVTLTQPLAPGASIQLDVTYSGVIAPSAERLLSIGAPREVAEHSDWDQISVGFTGLRGFGNVVWYPAASVPVLLGDGARLFDELGDHKLRLVGAHFRLRLTVEFPHGEAPTIELINGHSAPLAVTESNTLDESQEVASVATSNSVDTTLGFETPSLFVAIRTAHPGANLTAWTLPAENVSVEAWKTAATNVTPLLQSWLGAQPHTQLTLLDLPDSEDSPYETGSLLAAPLVEAGAKTKVGALDSVLVHALTHAWIQSPQPPPAWLNEGVANFMGTLWVEKQHGRDAALSTLEADRAALSLAEPTSPGESAGQPLPQAISPVYYRTKAAYVLWMLRDLVGDAALASALKTYYSAGGASFEKLLEASASHPDLGWFFADWVDADKGLPDLSIEGVFPTSESAGNWLVAVSVANAGYAAVEVPVTVRTESDPNSGTEARAVTQRLRIPARGKAIQRIVVQGKPAEAQVNDGTVPEVQASVHVTRIDSPRDSSSSSIPNTSRQ